MKQSDVMPTISTGQEATEERTVDGRFLTSFWGLSAVDVLATPSMLHLIEVTASAVIDPRLPEGYISLGLDVSLEHVAAAPKGSVVTSTARVTEVDGRRVTFDVSVTEGDRLIGRATHTRFVVNVERFQERLPAAEG